MPRRSFRVESGREVPAVTTHEMRAVDRVAVEEVGLKLLQMMENAGRALAWHVRDARQSSGGPAVVVAGNGGNGGGGLACARHLSNRGVPVEVVLDRAPEELTDAAAHQSHTLGEMGVDVQMGSDRLTEVDASVVVDALIGYGLTGRVREPARALVEETNRQSAPTVSLDVPSGLDATTGETLGAAVSPDRTVTLALPKTGLTDIDGKLYLADLGIPAVVYDRLDIDYESPFDRTDWVALY